MHVLHAYGTLEVPTNELCPPPAATSYRLPWSDSEPLLLRHASASRSSRRPRSRRLRRRHRKASTAVMAASATTPPAESIMTNTACWYASTSGGLPSPALSVPKVASVCSPATGPAIAAADVLLLPASAGVPLDCPGAAFCAAAAADEAPGGGGSAGGGGGELDSDADRAGGKTAGMVGDSRAPSQQYSAISMQCCTRRTILYLSSAQSPDRLHYLVVIQGRTQLQIQLLRVYKTWGSKQESIMFCSHAGCQMSLSSRMYKT
jgi:hypothetical protein